MINVEKSCHNNLRFTIVISVIVVEEYLCYKQINSEIKPIASCYSCRSALKKDNKLRRELET